MSTTILRGIDESRSLAVNPSCVEKSTKGRSCLSVKSIRGVRRRTPLPKGRESSPRPLVQRLRQWLVRDTLERDQCPVSGKGHCIDDPVVAIGGQGRTWRVYGHCTLCGGYGISHRECFGE